MMSQYEGRGVLECLCKPKLLLSSQRQTNLATQSTQSASKTHNLNYRNTHPLHRSKII